MTTTTRKEFEAELADKGISGPAAALILRATAHQRHAARTAATVKAAKELAHPTGCWRSMVAMDINGTGGPMSAGCGHAPDEYQMCSTTRMLQTLGAGRWHANDGAAYRAAAYAALDVPQNTPITPDMFHTRPFWATDTYEIQWKATPNESEWLDLLYPPIRYWAISLCTNFMVHHHDKLHPGALAFWAECYNTLVEPETHPLWVKALEINAILDVTSFSHPASVRAAQTHLSCISGSFLRSKISAAELAARLAANQDPQYVRALIAYLIWDLDCYASDDPMDDILRGPGPEYRIDGRTRDEALQEIITQDEPKNLDRQARLIAWSVGEDIADPYSTESANAIQIAPAQTISN